MPRILAVSCRPCATLPSSAAKPKPLPCSPASMMRMVFESCPGSNERRIEPGIGGRAAPPATPSKVGSGHRRRRIVTGIAAVVTIVLFLASATAVWAKRTVLSTDRVVTAVDQALTAVVGMCLVLLVAIGLSWVPFLVIGALGVMGVVYVNNRSRVAG